MNIYTVRMYCIHTLARFVEAEVSTWQLMRGRIHQVDETSFYLRSTPSLHQCTIKQRQDRKWQKNNTEFDCWFSCIHQVLSMNESHEIGVRESAHKLDFFCGLFQILVLAHFQTFDGNSFTNQIGRAIRDPALINLAKAAFPQNFVYGEREKKDMS